MVAAERSRSSLPSLLKWRVVWILLAMLGGACSSSTSSGSDATDDGESGTAERQLVEVEGGAVSVLVDRCGDGPAAMLLHGASFQAADWFDLGIAQALCAVGSDVVAVDLPGNGQTASFEHDPAALLQALVTAFPRTSLIVAPSMSGGYALPWSATYPSDIAVAPVAPVALDAWLPDEATAGRTTLIWGSADSIIPLSTGEEAATRTGARLEILADAGHAAYVDQPEAFVAILKAILAGISAGSGASGEDEGATADDPALDPSLIWTVVAVEPGDVLNVRASESPDADIMTTLAPWTTGVFVGEERAGPDGGRWRRVSTDDGADGWVNARFLVAQPATLSEDDRARMVEIAEWLPGWATEAPDGAEPLTGVFADRGLWIGGLGVFGDAAAPWHWLPTFEIDDATEWRSTRTWNPGWDEPNCSECQKSIADFLRLDQLVAAGSRGDVSRRPTTEAGSFASVGDADDPGLGFLHGNMHQAPPDLLLALVLDPGTAEFEIDWFRRHLVFDWSEGRPKLFMVNIHGWTP